TTRQLAGHLAGIRSYEEGEFLNQKHYASVREGLTIFQHDPLLHKPGSQYAYSTYGWTLISAVIEGASGSDFLSFIHASVFDPLGMRSTVADRVESIIEGRTRFYELGEDGLIRNAPYVDNSFKWAGGGFLSTTEDLVRFGSSLLEPGFFKSTTLRLFATSQRTTSGEPTEYSFGWRVGQDASGRHTLSHGSTAVGGRAALLIYPDAKVVVAFLCNLTNADIGDAVPRIAELFMD
ncbi:beta-lactamase family protein, partial [Candidatus Sumerlaeota bacterium]|nr:beta-lactamase family protein [Candidatus Sumerlaeota bacterium]